MKLELKRIYKGADYTIGRLFIDGKRFCDTLENAVRAEKVPHKTAIPAGRYRLILTESPKFGRVMPRLCNVPNFEGVLIHSGNTAADTDGCILVGENKIKGKVINSRATFERLFTILWVVSTGGEELEIEVKD